MTLFYYISHNLENIKLEARVGLISCSVLRHFQIYSRYDYYKRLGNTTTNAIIYCCEDFKIEQRAVYYIVKRMESEI